MANKFAQALKTSGTAAAQAPASTSPHARPSRRATKHVGGYFEPQVSKQLRQIALDEESSVQALLAEAIDMLFHSRQKPTIARRSDVVQS